MRLFYFIFIAGLVPCAIDVLFYFITSFIVEAKMHRISQHSPCCLYAPQRYYDVTNCCTQSAI